MADDDTPTTFKRDPTPVLRRDPTPVIKRDPTPVLKRDPPPDTSGWRALGKGAEHGATNLFYGGAQVGARMGPDEGGAAYAQPPDDPARQATWRGWFTPVDPPKDQSPPPPTAAADLQQNVDQTVKAREEAYRKDPNVQAHPWTAWAGNLVGEIGATLPFMVGAGAAPTLPARMVGAGIAAIPIGAARPVTDTEHYGREKVGQVTGEVIGSAGGQAVGETVIVPAAKYVIGWARRLLQNEEQRAAAKTAAEVAKEAAATQKATQEVTGKFAKAQKSGLVPGDVIKTMADAEAAGQPMTLMDVDPFPGSPVRRDVGNVYRGPGAAGRELEQFQEGRTYGQDPETLRTWQGNRLNKMLMDIRDKLSSGSARQTSEKLAQQRSERGKPLWDKAMAGGSTAPLEHQFTQEFTAATTAEATAAQRLREAQTRLVAVQSKQQTSAAAQAEAATTPAQLRARETAELGMQATTGASLPEHPTSAWNDELRAAESEFHDAQNDLTHIRATKEDIRARLKRAQADGTANAPGAVWSPALQRVLDNPELKNRGLALGYGIARNEADAAGTRFNPHEWAIVGMDEQGNPIVGSVPNMKLLQMAKQGLDALLEDTDGKAGIRDPLTGRLTKYGRSIDELRKTVLSEGDRLNPHWKEARDVWAGDTAELRALADGKHAFDRKADWTEENLTERWNEMAPGERVNFKLGAMDKLIEDLDFHSLRGDATGAMVNNPAAQRKLRLIMQNDAEFNQAVKIIKSERTMWQTGTSIMRGAQTAERLATDEQAKEEAAQAVLHASHGLWHAIKGNLFAAAHSMRRAASHIGWGEDPERVNLAKARLYTLPAGHPDLNLRVGPQGTLQIGPEAVPEPSLPYDPTKLDLFQEGGLDLLRAAGRGVPGRLPSSMYYSWPGAPPRP